jgi:malonate-semialdehyde dehydrogenase (acetylating)/methylmalonate-semialdehyde dehydrogenase
VFDPADGRVQATVPLCERREVRAAVDAAQAAFPAWAATTPLNRARILFKFKELLARDAERSPQAISREHGKVLSDARGELTRGMEVVEFACGIPHLLKGEHSMNVGGGVDSWSEYAPLGVVAGITPFNFPCMVPMWMFPSRSPAETPSSSSLRARSDAAAAAGAAAQGSRAAGRRVQRRQRRQGSGRRAARRPRVQAISFVGSTPIAEYIYARGSAAGKRVQALGGAKNHMVVMPDADLEQASNALLGAGYGSAGERCMAISVAVCVGDDTADALVAKLKPKVEALKVGPGCVASGEPDMGPLVTGQHRDRVRSYVDLGVEEGAQLVVDGRDAAGRDGFFLGGSLFDKVTPSMRIYREEIFGPVLSVVRVPGLRRRAAAGRRARVRQRHRHLHPRRRGRAAVRAPRAGRAWSASTCRSGADGLPQLRRLEALAVRAAAHARARRRALLHAHEDGDGALAGRARRPPNSTCRR